MESMESAFFQIVWCLSLISPPGCFVTRPYFSSLLVQFLDKKSSWRGQKHGFVASPSRPRKTIEKLSRLSRRAIGPTKWKPGCKMFKIYILYIIPCLASVSRAHKTPAWEWRQGSVKDQTTCAKEWQGRPIVILSHVMTNHKSISYNYCILLYSSTFILFDCWGFIRCQEVCMK